MSLVKYQTSPFGGILDNFLTTSFPNIWNENFTTTSPSINIIEDKDQFIVEVASPGLQKENFEVKIDDDHLVIAATEENHSDDSSPKYSRREFNYTSFKRSFYLPDTIDSNKVEAQYKEGILAVTLAKKPEAVDSGPKEIAIG